MSSDSYQINAIVGISNATGTIGAAVTRQKALSFSPSFTNLESKTNLFMQLSKASAEDIAAGIDNNKIVTAAALAAAGIGPAGPSSGNHGDLTGLGDDDHEQYFRSDGRGNGQTIIGGVNPEGILVLQSTNNESRGVIYVNDEMVINSQLNVGANASIAGGLNVGDYVSTGNVIATGSATVADITLTNGNIFTSDDNSIIFNPNGLGLISFSNKRAINGAMPVDLSDLTTKEYVDNRTLVVGSTTGTLADGLSIGDNEINIDVTKFTNLGTTANENVVIGQSGNQLIVLSDNANLSDVIVQGSIYGGIFDNELLTIRATSSITNNGTVQIMTETEAVDLSGNGAALHIAGGVAIAKKLIIGDEITTNRLDGPDNINIVLNPKGTGVIDVSSSQIINVSEPTENHHAATKNYVDAVSLQRPPVTYAVLITDIQNYYADGNILSDVGTNPIGAYFPEASIDNHVAVYGSENTIGIYRIADASVFNWYLVRIEIPLPGYTYPVIYTKNNVIYTSSINGILLDVPDVLARGQTDPRSFVREGGTYIVDPRYFTSISSLAEELTINPDANFTLTSPEVSIYSTTLTSINTVFDASVSIGQNASTAQEISLRAGTDGGRVFLSGERIVLISGTGADTSINVDNGAASTFIGTGTTTGTVSIGTESSNVVINTATSGLFFNPGISSPSGANLSISPSGQVGVTPSTRASKENIVNIGDYCNVTSIIDALEPKAYNFRANGEHSIGLIAEDVDTIISDIVPKDLEGKPITVRYELLSVILLAEIKRQKAIIESQQTAINSILALVNELRSSTQP